MPLTSQPPSVLVALVLAAKRSEPEPGSLMPMAKHNSPRQMRGRISILIFSLRVLDQHRAALPVGREMAPDRRVGDAELLGHHVALEEAALVAAIFLGPGHADPAASADALATELAAVHVLALGIVRIEGAGRHLLGDERAHVACAAVAFGRQAHLLEIENGAHGSTPQNCASGPPTWATIRRRRPSPPCCRAPAPNGSRDRNRRASSRPAR